MATKEFRQIDLKVSEDGQTGTFLGRLSAYGKVDSYSDSVAPGAYKRTIEANKGRVPLLWMHQQSTPVGIAHLMDQEDGLWIKGELVLDDSVPNGKMAYTLLKRGVIKGLSIGFQAVQKEMKDDGIRLLKEIRLMEASIVTTPADEHAMVTDIKAMGDGTSDFAEELAERQIASAGYCLVDILQSSLMQAWWNAGYDDDGDLAEDMPQILSYAEGVINDFKEAFLKALAAYGAQSTDSDADDAKSVMAAAKLSMMERKASGKTKRVDGEDLPASAFLIVGSADDTSTWKLPVKFSTDDKTKCLVGDTPIPLMDGTTKPIKDVKEGDWVYSFDVERRTVAPGRVEASVLSGVQVPIIRVTLDNGEKVECTDNHPFLLLTGQYKMAGQLEPGDSIMPLYRSEHAMWRGKGQHVRKNYYERVFQPWYGTWEFTHRLSNREATNTPLFPGNHIHHIDEDHRNNRPDNLEQLSASEHMKRHADTCGWWGGRSQTQQGKALMARWNRPGAAVRQSQLVSAENDKRKRSGITYGRKRVDNLPAIYERYAAGESMKSLGQETGTSGHTLNRLFVEAGYTKLEVPCNVRTVSDIRDLHVEYMDGSTLRQIAVKAGVSTSALLYKWKALGLQAKKTTEEALNHKVLFVEVAGLADVYDLQVDKYENFAIGQGVFVHNSHVRNALARINQVQGVSSGELAAAKKKLMAIAKRLGIDAGKSNESPIEEKSGKKISAETAESMKSAHGHVKAAMESMKSAGMVLQSLYDGTPAGDGTDPDGSDSVKSGDPGTIPLVDLLKELKETFVA